MADASDTLMSLDSYPHVRGYVVLNTGLPPTTAVERLFSLGDHVFRDNNDFIDAKNTHIQEDQLLLRFKRIRGLTIIKSCFWRHFLFTFSDTFAVECIV